MFISEKGFYSYFVLIIALVGSLGGILCLIFEENSKTIYWVFTLFYTLYLTDYWNHKKTGETSAFRRDAFLITQIFLSAYMRWGA